MKKNGFLVFCFAFVPGAGQMYQGYMKRGLSMAMLLAGSVVLTWLFSPLGMLVPVVWMYSFFDTFNIHYNCLEGHPPVDDYMMHLGEDQNLLRLVKGRSTLVGWILVALGVYMLYINFVREPLLDLAIQLGLEWMMRILYNVPQLLAAVALLAVGVWLVRGPRTAHGDREEIPPYRGEE